MLNPSTPKAEAIDDDGPSALTSLQRPRATTNEVKAAHSVVTVVKTVDARCGASALTRRTASAAPRRIICGSKAHQLTDGPTKPTSCRPPISGRPYFHGLSLQLRERQGQVGHNRNGLQDVK